ncbi:hypothetical protein Tco_1119059, partial [Tanacetum coccineum]
ADEDRQIATKLNRLREEMLVICEKRRNLMVELRSIRGIVVVGKAVEFVSDTVRKDNAQVEQLREIESQMEFRALDQNPETMNNSVTIAYRFEITLQLCFFDGSKPKNNDELQPRLSNFFKNFDSNGGDDLCYQGGLDQSAPLDDPKACARDRFNTPHLHTNFYTEKKGIQHRETINTTQEDRRY